MTPREAAELLKKGELVVFPTETVYGIGAIASSDEAVQKIFQSKGRPQHNPLILHISELRQLDSLVENIPEDAHRLIAAFWPGPLTICFRKKKTVSDLVTAGLPTVCIRMPDHPVAQELLRAVGEAVAAPSANLSGKPSSTRFQDAVRQLTQSGVSFLDGGDTQYGLESTVVDCSGDHVEVLRPGIISAEDLSQVIGKPVRTQIRHEDITSPGQLLNHYAPSGTLTVLYGPRSWRREWIHEHVKKGEAFVGFVGDLEQLSDVQHSLRVAENEEDLKGYAATLYGFLNWCDEEGADSIVLELPEGPHPLIEALLNRLEKASGGNVIRPSDAS